MDTKHSGTAHGSGPAAVSHAHAAPTGFIRKYVFSLDHKVIGLQYFFLELASVFTGFVLSVRMRIHMVWPQWAIPRIRVIRDPQYLGLLTLHGTAMGFLVLT